MNVNYLGAECLNLIQQVVTEAYELEEEHEITLLNGSCSLDHLRRTFVYRHLRNLWDLGEDALWLHQAKRTTGIRLIARAMLEGLFSVGAAVKSEGFAVEKLTLEIQSFLKKADKLVAPDGDWKETANLLKSVISNLELIPRISSNKKWRVLETAQAAELDHHYDREYFLLSQSAHVMVGGLISQEHRSGDGLVLQTVLYVMVAASGLSVTVLPSKSPQGTVDRASALLGELLQAIQQGVFREAEGSL